MKFKNYLILLFFFIAAFVNAQTIEIKGTVTNSKDKQPIFGANIVVKNSKKGVTTDIDGNFNIKVNPNDVLVFSNVGFTLKEIKVEKSQVLNVSLIEEANKLEEVVINVGYGTQKKKNVTSAISTVKSDAFDDRPIYNVAQALQGNASGVNVVQPSGKPGVALDIRIRGLSSIQSGNNPLFVIDGVQTYSSDGLNTDDIVDIQILKDATSTAIYGVNGSAGVVLITTKKGKANKNIFNFNSYYGSSEIVKNIAILNPDQYKSLMAEISPTYVSDANNPLYAGINTDWTKKVFQTGQDQNYNLSYAGGTEKIKAFVSLGYQDTQGIVKPSNFKRLSGRINLDVDATTWLKAHVGMNLINTQLNNTSDNNSANQGGVILSALTTPAFLPVYADDLVGGAVAGGQLPGQFAANPTASLENPVSFQSRQEDTNGIRYLGNLSLDVTLLKNLIWKPSSSIDMSRNVYQYFVDSYRSNYGRNNNSTDVTTRGIGREHTASYSNRNLENTLNYSIKSENHDLNLLVGNSIQKERYDQLKIEGTGFDPSLRKLDISKMMYTDPKASDTIATEKNYVSYFGRATYNYKEKYIVNGVFRATGASQLAAKNKWGFFPGVSAAWIISNENFLKNNTTVSELKLRLGWGQTGNISGVGPYSSYGLLGDDGGNLLNYINTDLSWETTTDINIGIDFGMIDNRIRLTADTFKKTTTDLINTIYIEGAAYVYNAGKMENTGLELALNTINFKGDFNWNTNFNITFIKNKILEMGLQPIEYSGYQNVNRLEKGQPLGNFYGYVVDRVNPATGILEYKDINGDGAITPQDRTIIGNAMPDYYFGFTNTFSYKGFSLDVLFTGVQGNDVFNASRIDLEGMQNSKNQSIAVLDRWTTPGQITNIPKAHDATSTLASDRFVEDGSYVRLKAVTLGYSFNKLFWGLNSLKFYATGQNLVTWTNYSGFDPEVNSSNSNNGTAQGIDYGTYPQVRTFIFGLKAGF